MRQNQLITHSLDPDLIDLKFIDNMYPVQKNKGGDVLTS